MGGLAEELRGIIDEAKGKAPVEAEEAGDILDEAEMQGKGSKALRKQISDRFRVLSGHQQDGIAAVQKGDWDAVAMITANLLASADATARIFWDNAAGFLSKQGQASYKADVAKYGVKVSGIPGYAK